MNWHETPFLRFLPFLLVGMVGASLWDDLSVAVVAGAALFLSLFGLALLRSPRTEHRKRWRFGIVLYMALLMFGYCLGFLRLDLRRPGHYSRFPREEACYFLGKVLQVKTGARTDRLELEVLGIKLPETGSVQTAGGRLAVYLSASDSTGPVVKPGSKVAFRAQPRSFDPPRNPKAFDFGKYMRRKGYYFQCYAESDRFLVLPSEGNNSKWSSWVDRLRERCLQIFEKHLTRANDFGFAAALVLGHREAVNEEIYSAYAETGAIHVLAVSGLHVGLVYLGLGFLFRFLDPRKWPSRVLKGILVLSGIWLFAVFTGASPSALRAAAMFSFMIIGRTINRHGNIYNTLAASAFCLLCVDPGLVYETGFQLSYLAVAGIVFFQAPIFRMWYIQNTLARYAWKLNSVSLGAQLTTFPLTLYLFHQFPVYFWLSGLVVIPMATLILPAGILLLLLDAVPVIGDGLGLLLHFLVSVTNSGIFLINRLPGGLISGIWPGIPGLLAGFFLTICLMRAVALHKLRPALWGLAGLSILGILANIRAIRQANDQELIIYHIQGQTAIDLFSGHTGMAVSNLAPDDPKLQQAASGYRAFRRIRITGTFPIADAPKLAEHPLFRSDGFVQFYQCKFFILEQLPEHPPPAPADLDLLLVCNNPDFDPSQFTLFFNPKVVVIDGSNSRQTARRWENACTQSGIRYHYTATMGAFVQHL